MPTRFGAVPCEGGVRFRVPAPGARELTLVLRDGRAAGHHRLSPAGDGMFEAVVQDAAPGDRYSYSVNGGPLRPDPASRFQPDGVHGPSEIINPSGFRWTDGAWPGRSARNLILYELHVGTFSPQGTFAGARAHLPLLRDLGITAIELMPVADFPGARNWGYDGVCLFAPSRAYGRPDDLRALVDAAHGIGLAVILDLVYNHLGPEGAYLPEFIPDYLTDRHETPWGRAVNLDAPGSDIVRRFIVANAETWVREYHLDGLRLDATHALIDESPTHILTEIAGAARGAVSWQTHIYAEDHRNLAALLDPSPAGIGLDGVWADDFHHAVRRRLAGDAHGYYSEYTGVAGEVARTIRDGWLVTPKRGTDPSHLPMRHFIVCLQNHDQVGNRARGDRLHHAIEPAMWRAASVLLLTVPMTPLLFMGQEWAAGTPFQFFTDLEAGLGRLVTQGRRSEFAAFPEFSNPATRETIPDPQAASTFEASRLRWDERQEPGHREVLELYRALLQLRCAHEGLGASDERTADVEAPDDDSIVLCRRAQGETFWIVVRFTREGTVAVPLGGQASVLLSSEEPRFAPDPQPPAIDWQADGASVHFRRAGAVILYAHDAS